MRRTILTGRRTGLVLKSGGLQRDTEGFEDIDTFWTHVDKPVSISDAEGPVKALQDKLESPLGGDMLSPPSASPGDSPADLPSRRLSFARGVPRVETPQEGTRPTVPVSAGASSGMSSSYMEEEGDPQGDDTEEEEEIVSGPEEPPIMEAEADDDDTEDDEMEDAPTVVPEVSDDVSRGRRHVGVTPDDGSARRSRRVRYPPLAYWKNERYVYERRASEGLGEVLPTVAGVSERTKTPAAAARKKRPRPRKIDRGNALPSKDLPQGREFKKHEKAKVWSEEAQRQRKMTVIARSSQLEEGELPITAKRTKDESSRVGAAAQAFKVESAGPDLPTWISGHVVLPPHAIKDPERVGNSSQVFFVADCQPKSLEVAIGLDQDRPTDFDRATAQRFLLSSGDQFYIPPFNIYRLENHSEDQDCKIFWAIIQSAQDPDALSETDE